ncbi:hypothetical protein HNY73_002762 [Argiope bruennichi]|uniref:Uncharacterized protein n=1 Tax=Argiope bruennichi TaxID=94029 RepID=A0A8T0FXE0_ARGBR|nr:hypothetical protein HNY73_002762 [Argiope bruennichi]
MIISDTPTPIKGFKGLTYKDFKKSSDSDSNEITEPSMQTDSKIQVATKRKKTNVKMKTMENRSKDKRPCISHKGKEKERNDLIANAMKAKNVDARAKIYSTDDNHGPTFANVVKKLNRDEKEGNKKNPLKLVLSFIRSIQASKKLLMSEERNQIQKMINLNEKDFKSTLLLRPKAYLPKLVVRPITETIDSLIEIRKTLEANINPKEMEIKIMGLKPAMGNGVLILVGTPEMIIKLKDAINSHTNLQNVCKATTSHIRMPQIIFYDVEKSETPREKEELDFLNQIKRINGIVGGMRVLYRKKGRGSSTHWVISLELKVF